MAIGVAFGLTNSNAIQKDSDIIIKYAILLIQEKDFRILLRKVPD